MEKSRFVKEHALNRELVPLSVYKVLIQIIVRLCNVLLFASFTTLQGEVSFQDS